MRLWIASAFLAVSMQASAATVEVFGTNLKFTYDDATLFGTINVVGDSFHFLPTEFSATSLNGQGAVTTVDTIQVRVDVITPGTMMTGFSLFEDGDYDLTLGATAKAGGELAVTSLTALSPNTLQPFRDVDPFDTGTLINPLAVTQWSVNSDVNLADTAGWNSDTSVTVTIQNWLSATTLLPGQEAEMQKKFVGVGVSVVPIPAAAWLMGSALFGLTAFRRRRTRTTR